MTIVVVLQYAEPPTPNACPLSQGFWKNKVEYWPVDSLMLGSQPYSLAELITILKTEARADASLILAYQLIAAKANIAWGSDPAPIADVIAQADDLLSGFVGKLPYTVRPNTKKGRQMTALGKSLEQYNLKILTPTCNPLAPAMALTQSEREIRILKIDVEILKSVSILKKELLHELRMKLDMAILSRENAASARLAILSFKTQVIDLMREAAIPAIHGQRLIEKADRILLRIGY
jgi:hypothetical protein